MIDVPHDRHNRRARHLLAGHFELTENVLLDSAFLDRLRRMAHFFHDENGRILINTQTAAGLGLEQDDWVELKSPIAKTRGRVAISQGVRPDTLVVPGQFGHWATPFAKDLKFPSLNKLAPMSLDLTDSTGSGADMVRVSVTRLGDAA